MSRFNVNASIISFSIVVCVRRVYASGRLYFVRGVEFRAVPKEFNYNSGGIPLPSRGTRINRRYILNQSFPFSDNVIIVSRDRIEISHFTTAIRFEIIRFLRRCSIIPSVLDSWSISCNLPPLAQGTFYPTLSLVTTYSEITRDSRIDLRVFRLIDILATFNFRYSKRKFDRRKDREGILLSVSCSSDFSNRSHAFNCNRWLSWRYRSSIKA